MTKNNLLYLQNLNNLINKYLPKTHPTATVCNKRRNFANNLETDIKDTNKNLETDIKTLTLEIKVKDMNYKNVVLLKLYVSANGLIFPKIRTKLSHKQHRLMSQSVKYARMLALLPYTSYHFF